MDSAAPPPAWQLMPLMDGFLTTQLLYVAAKLGVADVLSEGPAATTTSPTRSALILRCCCGCCVAWRSRASSTSRVTAGSG